MVNESSISANQNFRKLNVLYQGKALDTNIIALINKKTFIDKARYIGRTGLEIRLLHI